MATAKERLVQYKDYLGLNMRPFEVSIGVSNGSISHAGDNLSVRLIDKVCKKYPQLSREWLISGSGCMIIQEPCVDMSTNKQVNNGCENVTGNWTSADYQDRIKYLEAHVERLQRQLDEERADRRKAEERIDKLLSML